MNGLLIGKSVLDFLKFVLGLTLVLVVALMFVWGMSAWHNEVICKYQSKKIGLIYDYSYLGGCYFFFQGKWVPSSRIDYCRVGGNADGSR